MDAKPIFIAIEAMKRAEQVITHDAIHVPYFEVKVLRAARCALEDALEKETVEVKVTTC